MQQIKTWNYVIEKYYSQSKTHFNVSPWCNMMLRAIAKPTSCALRSILRWMPVTATIPNSCSSYCGWLWFVYNNKRMRIRGTQVHSHRVRQVKTVTGLNRQWMVVVVKPELIWLCWKHFSSNVFMLKAAFFSVSEINLTYWEHALKLIDNQRFVKVFGLGIKLAFCYCYLIHVLREF